MAPIGLKAVVGESKTFFPPNLWCSEFVRDMVLLHPDSAVYMPESEYIFKKKRAGGAGCGWLLVHLSGDDDNGEGDVPLYPDVNRRGVVRKHWMPCGGCSVSLVSCGADAQLHFKRQSVKNAVDKR